MIDADTRRAARCRWRDARHGLAAAALAGVSHDALEGPARELLAATAAVLETHAILHTDRKLQLGKWARYAARALTGEVAGGLLVRARLLAEIGAIAPHHTGDSP